MTARRHEPSGSEVSAIYRTDTGRDIERLDTSHIRSRVRSQRGLPRWLDHPCRTGLLDGTSVRWNRPLLPMTGRSGRPGWDPPSGQVPLRLDPLAVAGSSHVPELAKRV